MSQYLLPHPQLPPENDVYEGLGAKRQEPVVQPESMLPGQWWSFFWGSYKSQDFCNTKGFCKEKVGMNRTPVKASLYSY